MWRQFSPFEFFAQACNDARDPDAVWNAYNEGVRVGALRAAREAAKALASTIEARIGL